MKGLFYPIYWLLLKIKKVIGSVYRFLFHGPVYWGIMRIILPSIYFTRGNESAVTFKIWFFQKVLGFNRHCYWPVHFTSTVRFPQNICIGIDVAPGISPGCYIQAVGKIYIGDYTQIAPNVGIISANHFMLDIRKHVLDEVRLGDYCRIGMGSIILPGVVLGDFTTVSAGSIVTKSFPQGYCVLAGNPAIVIADYSIHNSIRKKFVRYKNKYEYNGYIPHGNFENYKKLKING